MNILIVEDDPGWAHRCIELLIAHAYSVVWVQNVPDAERLMLESNFDVVIADLMLPPNFNEEGLKLLRSAKEYTSNPSIFFMTVRTDSVIPIVNAAMEEGAIE